MAQYTYDYPHPGLTTDSVVLSRRAGEPHILLIQRRSPPFQGMWALPGGFLDPDETLDHCAARELFEETGLTGLDLHPFANFSTPGRDPRGWTVSAAYVTVAPADAEEGRRRRGRPRLVPALRPAGLGLRPRGNRRQGARLARRPRRAARPPRLNKAQPSGV